MIFNFQFHAALFYIKSKREETPIPHQHRCGNINHIGRRQAVDSISKCKTVEKLKYQLASVLFQGNKLQVWLDIL